jgi:hypothetical protein
MKTIILVLCVILNGCATCERHPVACTAAVAFVGASIALSVSGGHSDPTHPIPKLRVK